MKNITVFLVVVCAALCAAKDLVVRTSYGSNLTWRAKANYVAFPFIKRVKEVFYSNPQQLPIKGIIARDLDQTEADATITAGGIGFSYVNLRLKSLRGNGLNYQIEIYI